MRRPVRTFFVAVLCLACLACGWARAPQGKPIEFIEDDYPRALSEARARGVPLFVDAWAPWCHTCLSLRAYVFPDPSLRRFASRFVWLSVDTEREKNAAFVEKLGIHVLPTLFVIDAASETPALAWPGSLTAAELAKLLDDALRTSGGDGAEAALRRGQQATAAGRKDDALAAYRAALAAAPPAWPRRPEALDALVTQLDDSDGDRSASDKRECARMAASVAPSMPPGTARADVVRVGIQCATESGAGGDGGRDDAGTLEALTSLGETMAGDPHEAILADDRSDLFDFVAGGWTSLGRPDDAHRVAQHWAAFLEGEAARATSPAARAVFDAHRVAAYLALGEPARALPMLEESARDFPNDYNPPARMGRALLALGRPDEAIASLDRALGLAYGPRKLTLWSLEADAYVARGDRAGGAANARDRARLRGQRSVDGRLPEAPSGDGQAPRGALGLKRATGPVARRAVSVTGRAPVDRHGQLHVVGRIGRHDDGAVGRLSSRCIFGRVGDDDARVSPAAVGGRGRVVRGASRHAEEGGGREEGRARGPGGARERRSGRHVDGGPAERAGRVGRLHVASARGARNERSGHGALLSSPAGSSSCTVRRTRSSSSSGQDSSTISKRP